MRIKTLFLEWASPKYVGTFFIVISLAFSPAAGGGNEPWGAALRQGLLSLALFFGALGAGAGKKFLKKSLDMEILLTLFGAACFFSWLVSNYELSSRLEMADVVLFTGVFFGVAWGLKPKETGYLTRAAVLVGAAYALFAIYQKLALGQSRCASTLFNPNFAASFFLGALGYSLGLLTEPYSGKFWRVLNLLCLGVLVAGLWCTGSRSGLAGLVLLGGTFVWVTTRKARWAIAGAALLVLALIIFPNPARDRLSKGVAKDPYAFDRIRIWEQTLRIIRDHPLMGVGIGNFEYSTQAYRFPVDREIGRFGRVYRDAHNSYLQVAAEVGLPAASLLLVAVFLLFRRIRALLGWLSGESAAKTSPKPGKALFQQNRECSSLEPTSVDEFEGINPATARAQVIGALLALIGVMSQAFFHEIVDSPPSIFLAVLAVGLVGFHWRRYLEARSALEWWKASPGADYFRLSKSVYILVAVFLVLVFWPHFSLRVFLADQVFRKAEDVLGREGSGAAEQLVRKAIQLNPSQAYFHKTLGDLLTERFEETGELGYLQKAEEEFQTAASINRLDPQLVFQLGQFYRYVSLRGIGGKEVENSSLQAYRKAVQMSPFNVHYLARLAVEDLRQKNFSQAMQAAQRAVELESRFLAGLFLLVQVSRAMGNDVESEKWLEKMMEAREAKTKWVPLNEYERLLMMEPEKYFGQDLLIWTPREKNI